MLLFHRPNGSSKQIPHLLSREREMEGTPGPVVHASVLPLHIANASLYMIQAGTSELLKAYMLAFQQRRPIQLYCMALSFLTGRFHEADNDVHTATQFHVCWHTASAHTVASITVHGCRFQFCRQLDTRDRTGVMQACTGWIHYVYTADPLSSIRADVLHALHCSYIQKWMLGMEGSSTPCQRISALGF